MGRRMRAAAAAVVLAVFGGVLGAIPASFFDATPAVAATDSTGTDFWLTFPENASGASGLELFIAGATATTGSVEIPGLGSSQPFSVTPGAVTTVAINAAAGLAGADTVGSNGIRVTAGAEVSVYGLNRITASTDAYLGLPTDILGTEYIIESYTNSVVAGTELAVVAPQNGTTVTVTPSVAAGDASVGLRPAGVPFTVPLDQGQTYQLQGLSPAADLTGSIVTADKPIAVFGGHRCANVPVGFVFCDHIVEQMTPTNTWGQSFVTEPLATRLNGDTFRFLASTANTTVRVNGAIVATLGRGQFHERILTTASVVTSDQPILVTQFSNGSSFDNVTSDPFQVIVPPSEQFLNAYTVTTPASGFGANFINVVAPTSSVGTITLDGAAVPPGSFTAIPGSSFSGAQLSVSLGSHTLGGAQPFGITVYGFAIDDSYGYPGGLSLAPVASVETVTVTPGSGIAATGSPYCVTATVRDQANQPLPGPRVDFSVTGANTATGFADANAGGVAEFCYTGTNAGADAIQAAVGTVVGNATVNWTSDVSPLAITLAPATSSGPVGSTYTATATVTRDGVRQSGVDVTFVITSGPNGETSFSAVTNADGVAELSYISELAGTDTLFARVIDGETPVDSNSVTREWTPVAPTDLTIASEGQPDAVTAGASALRIITVTNPGEGTAEDVSISFTLAPGTTLVRTTPSQGTCGPVVEGTVTCELGDLAGGASANVRFVVSTPAVIPPGGTITTSATAQEGDGTPVGPAQSTTTLTPPTPGAASGYVPPGGTLTTGGDATPGNDTVASLTLPNSGDGAVVTLTSVPCAPGECFGKTVTFNDFPGYDDPTKPIRFTTLYDKSVRGTGLFSQLYVLKDTDTQFRFIPPCTKPGETKLRALARYFSGLLIGGRSGVAVPSPCVNKKEQLKNGDLRYETLFTSGDPGVRRR